MKKQMLMLGTASFLFFAVPSISFADTVKTEVVKKTTTVVSKKVVKTKHRHKKKYIHHDQIIDNRKNHAYKPRNPKRIHADPTKVISQKEEKKCQFLFWDVACASFEDTKRTPEVKITENSLPSSASKTLEKGATMMNMDSRHNRKELTQRMSQTFGFTVDPARTAWCAGWANTVLADLGITGTNSLMARSFLNWGQAVRQPEEGDVVVFRRGRSQYAGHVGFYVGTVEMGGRKYVAVLGGNQDHSVKVAYYDAARVLGYRKPTYS